MKRKYFLDGLDFSFTSVHRVRKNTQVIVVSNTCNVGLPSPGSIQFTIYVGPHPHTQRLMLGCWNYAGRNWEPRHTPPLTPVRAALGTNDADEAVSDHKIWSGQDV